MVKSLATKTGTVSIDKNQSDFNAQSYTHPGACEPSCKGKNIRLEQYPEVKAVLDVAYVCASIMATVVQFLLLVYSSFVFGVPVSALPIAKALFRRNPGIWKDPPSDGLPYLVRNFQDTN